MWVDTVCFDSQIRVNCDRFKNIISHITLQHVSIEMVTNLMLVVCLLKHVLVSIRVPRLFECTTDAKPSFPMHLLPHLSISRGIK